MTKREALQKGYCQHCAAYHEKHLWRCGITRSTKLRTDCILQPETIERWRGEWGLEGETQRSPSRESFGDADLMKKKKGRKPKRHLR